jgi:hypothetical protein
MEYFGLGYFPAVKEKENRIKGEQKMFLGSFFIPIPVLYRRCFGVRVREWGGGEIERTELPRRRRK